MIIRLNWLALGAASPSSRSSCINPHYPDIYLHFLALAHFHLERYDDAIGALTRRLFRKHVFRDVNEGAWLCAVIGTSKVAGYSKFFPTLQRHWEENIVQEPALRAGKVVAAKSLFEGVGVIVAVQPRTSRLVLTHEEIKGFMAPMVGMSFMVTPATLLQGLEPGDDVRFTIDADKRVIVDVAPLGE